MPAIGRFVSLVVSSVAGPPEEKSTRISARWPGARVSEHQRDVVDAVLRWQIERGLRVVPDDQHAGETEVDLPRGFAMDMGMIKERGRGLADRQDRPPCRAGPMSWCGPPSSSPGTVRPCQWTVVASRSELVTET